MAVEFSGLKPKPNYSLDYVLVHFHLVMCIIQNIHDYCWHNNREKSMNILLLHINYASFKTFHFFNRKAFHWLKLHRHYT